MKATIINAISKTVLPLCIGFMCSIAHAQTNSKLDFSTMDIKKIEHYAKKGNAEAQCALANNYYFGHDVEINYTKTVFWLKKAAKQGLTQALYNLGTCYFNGKGVTKDPAQGIFWYEKAAEKGHVRAQYYLGESYYEGNNIPQDITKAV